MRPDEGQAVDWRDGAAYAPLLNADRSIFAWEWLRRDQAYRYAALGERPSADESWPAPERWGLHAFENPHLAAPAARPLWRADIHAAVLPVVGAEPGAASDAFDLARFAAMATILRSADGREHLLISDGLRTIRLDILAGTASGGPVQLRYLLTGFESAERPLATLRRLVALQRTGRLGRSLHRPESRARKWILMLRAHDALAAGAGQREIAAALLSRVAGEPRWRSRAPSLRSQAQRLVRAARQMASGGYRKLLR